MNRFVLLTLALSAACSSPESASVKADVHDLRLTRRGAEYPIITGTLVNESNRPLSSADVFLTLYDENNVPFPEPRVVQVRGVAPGDSSRFTERLDVQARSVSVKYIAAN